MIYIENMTHKVQLFSHSNEEKLTFFTKQPREHQKSRGCVNYYYCPIKINSVGVIYHRQGCKPLMRKIIYIISAIGATEN